MFTSNYVEESNLDCVFVMDMTEDHRGMVIYQSGKIDTHKELGDNYDISDHPVLDNILQSNSDQIVFESSSNIPNKGRYYIGYKPIFCNGKLRFGKKLNTVYDIRAMDFEIPLLSIQPLVENAVKHGLGQKKKGGTITITSEETEDAFIVTVADDGVGFDTNATRKEDGRKFAESPLNKSHSIRLFAGGLRKNGGGILRRGTPSLAGLSKAQPW